MSHLLCLGDWRRGAELLLGCHLAGHSVSLMHVADASAIPTDGSRPAIILAAASRETPIEAIAAAARRLGARWILWNQDDDGGITLSAYRSGARAVLPGATTLPILLQAIDHLAGSAPDERSTTPMPSGATETLARPVRRYRRGEHILTERDSVLLIAEGIVAITAVHSDGAEVLLGLCGPGQIVVSHPADSCSVHLVAHIDLALEIRGWGEVVRDPALGEQLRARLLQSEAWAAMQARPYLDERLLGILSLLADQFGAPHAEGVLIDVRVTHAQLAAATGATRTTITRLLRKLRQEQRLLTVPTGDGDRFCLPHSEFIDHALDHGHIH